MLETILVVEDQPEMLAVIVVALQVEGYHVLTANDGRDALDVLREQAVDLIVADIAMPNMNGYQLLEKVRQNPAWIATPFIFISGRTLDSDIYYGKTLGVDDYLTKPIDLTELRATVRGKLTRAQQMAQLAPAPWPSMGGAIAVGDLRIDSIQHRVWKGDREIELSPREFTLLESLAQRPGAVVSLIDLCRATHQLETSHTEAGSLLYPLVRSLRRRLGYAAGDMGEIESVRGVGYRLRLQDE